MDIPEQIAAAFNHRLTVERELGGGGMSRVFLAREHHPARPVVVKLLPPELGRETSAERFRREIDVAGALTHPHIVSVLYASAGDSLLAYAMPYIDGASLRDRLTASGALPVADAVRIWRDVLDALAFAHGRGVVHRDIKPENILLVGRHAMVTDFGVARALTAATGADRMTSTGLALGTPAYMAPEQAAADANTDARADIYSAALVMWEMLVGRHPYAGMTPGQMMVAHATRSPEPLATARASTPPLLADLVERCLAKEPADRPQSAEELLEALDALQRSDSAANGAKATTSNRPSEASVQERASLRRPRGRRLFLAGGLIVAAVAAAMLSTKLRQVPPTPGPGDVRAIVIVPNAIDPADSLHARGLYRLFASALEDIPRSAVIIPGQALNDYAERVWGMSAATISNPDTLRWVSQRLGATVLAEIDITRVGSSRALTAQLTAARDGRRIASVTESASSDADLLDAGRRLAVAVRARLADTLALIEPAPRLGVFSTSSPAAIDQARRGADRFNAGNYLAAAEQYAVAVQLDPEFAWGHRQIALAYNNLGIHRARRIAAIERARALAERARPVERTLILGLYYSAMGEADSTFSFYRDALTRSPNSASLLNNLSLIHRDRREFRAYEELVRNALSNSRARVWVGHTNLVNARIAQGDFGVADSLLAADSVLARSVRGQQLQVLTAIAKRDYAGAEQLIAPAAVRDTALDRRVELLRRRFDIRAARGQHDAAAAAGRDLERLLASIGAEGDALAAGLQRVQLAAMYGSDPATATRAYDELLARYPVANLHPLDRPYPALATAAASIGRVAEAKRWLEGHAREVQPRWRRIDVHEIEGAGALVAAADRDGVIALRRAIAADSGSCVPCTQPALAIASVARGDTAAATRYWERFLSSPSTERASADRFYLGYGLRQLGEFAEARGDVSAALQYYDRLLEVWADAEPATQRWLAPVRARVASLRRTRG